MFPRPSRFARRSKVKTEAKATQPVIENKAVEIAEDIKVHEMPEVKHLGGPWYQVGDAKYMGKAAAEEAVTRHIEELTA
jgi:hypothetical protein